MSRFLDLLRIILINFLIFFLIFISIEIFFGFWFKNNFANKISSERNIDRIYKFDFNNHKGTSRYIRNNLGFRVPNHKFNSLESQIVFAGGSTTNQKFLNYEDTIVGILQKKMKNKKSVNAGIDGMSLVGHINSFEYWFEKIENFKPKYFVFYIGANDRNNLDNNTPGNSTDTLVEPSKKKKIIEYLEANSFFYTLFRSAKTSLFIKTGNELFSNNVNSKTVVYGERSKKKFITFDDFERNNSSLKINKNIESLLNKLTSKVHALDAQVIYITQTSGYGMNDFLFIISKTVMKHCLDHNLKCINLAKEASLNYDDFYDHFHLNTKGSIKAANYIYKNLKSIID